jgi:hypothetical protein
MPIKIQWITLALWFFLLFLIGAKYLRIYHQYQKLDQIASSTPNITADDLQTIIHTHSLNHKEKESRDPYKQGIYLRNMILNNKLQVKSYRIIEYNELMLLEFQMSGSFDAMMQLLYQLYEENIQSSVFDLSLLQKGEVYVSIQIPHHPMG